MRGSVALLLLVCLAPPGLAEAENPSTAQAIEWLQQYVRIDSSTVEGTRQAADFLRDLLHRQGIATRWFVSQQGQPFLYAKTGGTEAPTDALLLLHHLDVVPAGEGWSQPPFAGEIKEEALFGRGAIDDKSLGVAHLVAFLRSARQKRPTSASLVLLAVGGEEAGGVDGLGWLLERYPEVLDGVSAVLTEGGSNRLFGSRLAWWGVEVAQKRPLWLAATSSGRDGHGSSINLHSAPHRLIRGLNRLVDRPLSYRITDEARHFLESAAPHESLAFQSVVERLDEIVAGPEPETRLLPGFPGYLLDTIQVNALEAGGAVNVIPREASARIDVRLLPDTDDEDLLQELRSLVGSDVALEVLLSSPRVPPSPTDHALFQCLGRLLGETAPVVPTFIPAITDARFVRARGVAAYGFSPFLLETEARRGIHGVDEHIPLDTFAQGVEIMWQVVQECTAR